MAILRKLLAASMPWGLANALEADIGNALVATGTSQSDALPIAYSVARFGTVASGTGAILPANSVGDSVLVINAGANALSVYPPSGHSINSLAVDAAYSIPMGGMVAIKRVTNTLWLGTTGDSAAQVFLQSGTGPIASTVQRKLREVKSLFDYMTAAQIADVIAGTETLDVTSAVQAAFDDLPTSGGCLYAPLGIYKTTSTLTITNKEGFLIYGAGMDSTQFSPSTALAEAPVIKITNCRDYELRDMYVEGNASGKPEAAVTFHRATSGGYAPTNMRLTRMLLGGTSNDLLNGVQTTADSDSNNSEGMFVDLKIRNVSEAGYTFEHSNSVGHRIIGGNIDTSVSGSVAVKTAGGSFTMFGTALNVVSYDFDIGNGTQNHVNKVIGVVSESNSGVVRTTTQSGVLINFVNYHKAGGTTGTSPVDFQSVDGRISFVGCNLNFGVAAATASFTDDGSVAHFTDCQLGFTVFSWAGHLTLTGNKHNPGAVTLTQASTGTFYQCGDIGGGFTPIARHTVATATGSTALSVLSGVLYAKSPATVPTTTGTTKETLYSYSLPQNALDVTVDGTTGGRYLKIRAGGFTAANANSKTIGIDFGATTVATLTNATNNGAMYVEAIVFSRSGNTQRGSGWGVTGTVTASTRSTPAEDITAGAVTITAFATTPTSAGDVSLDFFSVEVL